MKVARALLLGVGGLAILSGAAAHTCTTDVKAVAIFAGVADHSRALMVSRRPPLGSTRGNEIASTLDA